MPRITFTAHLREVAPRRTIEVDGKTVRAVLENVWMKHPRTRSYVMDEQGELRRHIAVFVDGRLVKPALEVPVRPDSEIYVMQALSGG